MYTARNRGSCIILYSTIQRLWRASNTVLDSYAVERSKLFQSVNISTTKYNVSIQVEKWLSNHKQGDKGQTLSIAIRVY